MNAEVILHTNPLTNTPFRVVERKDGNLLFLGTDVAKAMNIKALGRMYQRLDDDEKVLITPSSLKAYSQFLCEKEQASTQNISQNFQKIDDNALKALSSYDNPLKGLSSKEADERNSLQNLCVDIYNDSAFKALSSEMVEKVSKAEFANLVQKLGLDSKTFKLMFINESGIYSIIFKSRSQEAKNFKKWLSSQVLPVIRKNRTKENNNIQLENNLLLEKYIDLNNRLKKYNSRLDEKDKEIALLKNKIEKLKKVIVEVL